MKTKLLPSLREYFRLLLNNKTSEKYRVRKLERLLIFTDFPPKLYMFVPCDDEGNVLEKPECYQSKLLPVEVKAGGHVYGAYEDYVEQYQQALDRVIFDGFEVIQEEASKGRKWIYISVENERKLVIFFNGELYEPAGAQTIADLAGKVYLNSNGIKNSGI